MDYLNGFIILALIVLSFISGKHISDSYHSERIQELEYLLRLQAASQGVGYVQPPVRRRAPIGQDFMDKLKEHGRATQRIDENQKR